MCFKTGLVYRLTGSEEGAISIGRAYLNYRRNNVERIVKRRSLPASRRKGFLSPKNKLKKSEVRGYIILHIEKERKKK